MNFPNDLSGGAHDRDYELHGIFEKSSIGDYFRCGIVEWHNDGFIEMSEESSNIPYAKHYYKYFSQNKMESLILVLMIMAILLISLS